MTFPVFPFQPARHPLVEASSSEKCREGRGRSRGSFRLGRISSARWPCRGV